MRGSCRLPSNDILQSPSTKVLLLLLASSLQVLHLCCATQYNRMSIPSPPGRDQSSLFLILGLLRPLP